MLTRDQININRDKITDLWNKIERPGIFNLLIWLTTGSDFFLAPCSTEFHLAYPGGLAQHSLNVLDILLKKIDQYGGNYCLPITSESATICALGHDLCKVNFYIKGSKNVKIEGQWVTQEIYKVQDKFPMGHGEKSVSILQDFIQLTQEEKLAIRWHMAAFDTSIHFNFPNGFAFREASKIPLVVLLFTADYEASQIIETNLI